MRKPRAIVCECGGRLRPTVLEQYDFSDYVGFEVILKGMEGFTCDTCGGETISGGLVNVVMNYTVVQIVQQPRRLNGAEARYLRHNLDATQEELGTRMGIARETVAKWECGDSTISAQHDFILRVFSLAAMIERGLVPRAYAERVMAGLRAVAVAPPGKTTSIRVDQAQMDLMKMPPGGTALPARSAG